MPAVLHGSLILCCASMSSRLGSIKADEDVAPDGVRIYDDNGFDVTPRPLVLSIPKTSRKASVKSKFDESEVGSGSRQGMVKKSSRDGPAALKKSVVITEVVEKDYLKELEIVKENLKTCKLETEEAVAKPATITLYLEESAHHWHLHMPSTNTVKTDEVETQTEGPVIRRYRLDSAIQTYNPVSKKKVSQTAPIEMSTSCVFASEWDLYDTYRRLSYEDEEMELYSQDFLYGEDGDLGDVQRPSMTSESTISQGNEPIIASRKANLQALRVMKQPEFQYAVTVAERLLASNSFHEQQVAFMGSTKDSQELSTGFHYNMNELWAFSYEETRNRIVNAVSWNTANINVVAVGYGYVRGSEEDDGLVCCWSMKNPSQPEREFLMKSSVTTLSFSRTQPNLLALGCYNGAIIVLDIASKSGNKLVLNGEEGCLRYGPVGNLQWFLYTDFVVETEEIISVGKSGRVYKWNYLESYRSYEIMKLSYFLPSKRASTPKSKKSKTGSKTTLKFLNGLSVSLHPKNKMLYYVSTQEGCVVKCTMNHQDRFEDIFPAHAGPIYGILHSPFSSKIFCTYGSDWYICVWAEDLREPLLRLYYTKHPVLGVSWSPVHSTILATISGSHLSMWDLARKTIVPISSVRSSTGCTFSSLQFSTTGKNILVGDVVGDVFIFNLVDMPYPPFLQEEALLRALANAMVSKPKERSYLEGLMKRK